MSVIKRTLCLLLALMLLPVHAMAAISLDDLLEKIAIESPAPTLNFDDAYGRWEKVSGDKLKFRCKIHNPSQTKTVKAVELWLYAEDVWGDRIYGENTYYSWTTTKKIEPGETVYSDDIIVPNRSEIEMVYVAVARYIYTDGTDAVEIPHEELNYHWWEIKW